MDRLISRAYLRCKMFHLQVWSLVHWFTSMDLIEQPLKSDWCWELNPEPINWGLCSAWLILGVLNQLSHKTVAVTYFHTLVTPASYYFSCWPTAKIPAVFAIMKMSDKGSYLGICLQRQQIFQATIKIAPYYFSFLSKRPLQWITFWALHTPPTTLVKNCLSIWGYSH